MDEGKASSGSNSWRFELESLFEMSFLRYRLANADSERRSLSSESDMIDPQRLGNMIFITQYTACTLLLRSTEVIKLTKLHS